MLAGWGLVVIGDLVCSSSNPPAGEMRVTGGWPDPELGCPSLVRDSGRAEERWIGRFGEDMSDVRKRSLQEREVKTGWRGGCWGTSRSRAGVVEVVDENSGKENAGIRKWGFWNWFRAKGEPFWGMTTSDGWGGHGAVRPGCPRIWSHGLMVYLHSCHTPCQPTALHLCLMGPRAPGDKPGPQAQSRLWSCAWQLPHPLTNW